MPQHFLSSFHHLKAFEIVPVVDGFAFIVQSVLQKSLERVQHQGHAETTRAREHADLSSLSDQKRDKRCLINVIDALILEFRKAL